MQSSGRRFLPALLIAWIAFWVAPACFAEPEKKEEGPPVRVRLVSPPTGAALVAGSTAELEWVPLEPFETHIEEWEAFLSFDAGKTYPVRITPHLDQDIRRVRWQVPSLPTESATILLRFGDERRETSVELPVRFSIEASEAALPVWESTLQLAHEELEPGEPALPGEPGVVAWVEGSRRGEAARQVFAAEPASGMRERFDPSPTPGDCAEVASSPRSSGPSARIASRAGSSGFPASRGAALARAGAAPLPPSDILLLIQRQNE